MSSAHCRALGSLSSSSSAPHRPAHRSVFGRPTDNCLGRTLHPANTIDNILSKTSSLGDKGYTYDAFGPNAVTEVDGLTMDYDAGGFMVERGDQTLTWDFMGRLTHVTTQDSSNTPLARFLYGANQSRVARIEGDSTTLYPFRYFETRDGVSSLYVNIGRQRVARIASDSMATALLSDLAPLGAGDDQINAGDAWVSQAAGQGLVALDNNAPVPSEPGALLWSSVRRLLMETGPQTTFLHSNHLGSITLATDSDVVGQRGFTPAGQERGGVGYVDEYGFTGQEVDRSTGLVHFDWRIYDPSIGRWLSIDPLFEVATPAKLSRWGEATTAYAYVANNVVNRVDPTGLMGAGPSKPGGGGGGSGGGGSGGGRM
ncbi:MAG: RHS repeat-associated core domain-containing protein, partial [Myxococcota bacterium]